MDSYEKERKQLLAQQILILKIKGLVDEHLKKESEGHQAELRLIRSDSING